MKVNVSRKQVLDLFGCFEKMLENKSGVKFTLKVIKNKSIVEPEVKMFEEARKPSGELVAYDEERKKLIIEFAEKTEDGNLVVSGNNVKIIEDKMEEFTLKVEELNKKHDVDKLQLQLNNQQKEIDELLDETLELDLNSFKEDELESCGIDDVFCLELLFKVGLIE